MLKPRGLSIHADPSEYLRMMGGPASENCATHRKQSHMKPAILHPPSSILVFLCLLAGCTVGPNYQRPNVPVPDHFGATTRPVTEHVDFARWWTTFNDPLLNSLIDRAAAGNLDLKIAQARIREARAQ